MSLGDGAALTLVTVGQRQATAARVAVIDIGSNSVRMVVYEHGGRMPIPVFNEKALCGLGAGLAETGRLTAPAIAAARPAASTLAKSPENPVTGHTFSSNVPA